MQDRTLADEPNLMFSEKFFLWAMRFWAMGKRDQNNVASMLKDSFTLVNNENAYLAFEAMMTVLSYSGMRLSCFRCICSKVISEEEHVILAALSSLQAEQDNKAREYFGFIFNESKFELVIPSATDFAKSMHEGGMTLPPRLVMHPLQVEKSMEPERIETVVH